MSPRNSHVEYIFAGECVTPRPLLIKGRIKMSRMKLIFTIPNKFMKRWKYIRKIVAIGCM